MDISTDDLIDQTFNVNEAATFGDVEIHEMLIGQRKISAELATAIGIYFDMQCAELS